MKRFQYAPARTLWISNALEDAARRADLAWNTRALLDTRHPHIDILIPWAKAANLRQIVAMRPETGPLHDSLAPLGTALAREGIRIVLIDRPEDLRLRPLATGAFFLFGSV